MSNRHLFEDSPSGTVVPTECANCEKLANENRRMLTAIEAIVRISKDMLDPVRRAGPTAPREEMKAFGQAAWFPREARRAPFDAGTPHEPTMSEIIDVENSRDDAGLFDVVFSDVSVDGLLVRETRRGPYSNIDNAQSYAERNPERLPGTVSIRASSQGVRTCKNS